MEKSNKIFLIIILVCTLCVVGICGYAIMNHEEIVVSDAIKFKNEYETINGAKSEIDDKNYPIVSISESNPIVYKTGKEILDVLKNGEGLVYFGYSSSALCRNVVEPLLNASKENNVEVIYYVDILDIRDEYKFSGSIRPEKIKNGTDSYYEILKFFGSKLDKYYIKDEPGNQYDTGVKRLLAPTVISVKNGKIVGMHVNTVETQKDEFVKLNNKEAKELQDRYSEIINKL
ncbi:MAG: hypothetical protein RSG95_02775 [Bacilli bacterium]